MSEHPHALLVRTLFRAFHEADVAAIQAAIPEEAVWHFPGRHGQLAGSHRGKQAILGFLARVQALSAGSFGLELIDVLANDERAVALFRGHAKRNGLTLDNPTCLHMRIANGRIAEIWEFVWDLYDVDAFWT